MLSTEQQEAIWESAIRHKDRLKPETYGLRLEGLGTLQPCYEGCGVCVLGAYALDHPVLRGEGYAASFGQHFGVDPGVIVDITTGFDGKEVNKETPAYKFGKKLRVLL